MLRNVFHTTLSGQFNSEQMSVSDGWALSVF